MKTIGLKELPERLRKQYRLYMSRRKREKIVFDHFKKLLPQCKSAFEEPEFDYETELVAVAFQDPAGKHLWNLIFLRADGLEKLPELVPNCIDNYYLVVDSAGNGKEPVSEREFG